MNDGIACFGRKGVKEFREIFFKSYRIIYRVIECNLFALLVADGRRDMQTLRQQRLMEG